MRLKVIFKIVDQIDGPVEQSFVFTAVHQQCFRSEHFRDFGEDRCPSAGDQTVGKSTHHRICRDAGQSVGAAAFHTDDQLACRNRFPLKRSGIFGEFTDDLQSVCNLVFTFLCDEKTDAVRIVVADVFFQFVDAAVLTAKSEHKDAACIRMVDQIGEDLTGMLLIVSHLGAAVRMRKCGDLLHRPVDKLLCLPFDGGGNIVDASDCRNDPDAVADPDFSVFPSVALKITGIFRSKGRWLRIVSIGEKFTEPGF